jgi:hypothetical protein
MILVGCDPHTRKQQVAVLDTDRRDARHFLGLLQRTIASRPSGFPIRTRAICVRCSSTDRASSGSRR